MNSLCTAAGQVRLRCLTCPSPPFLVPQIQSDGQAAAIRYQKPGRRHQAAAALFQHEGELGGDVFASAFLICCRCPFDSTTLPTSADVRAHLLHAVARADHERQRPSRRQSFFFSSPIPVHHVLRPLHYLPAVPRGCLAHRLPRTPHLHLSPILFYFPRPRCRALFFFVILHLAGQRRPGPEDGQGLA